MPPGGQSAAGHAAFPLQTDAPRSPRGASECEVATHPSTLPALASTVLAAVLLAACSGDAPTTASKPTATAAAATATATATATAATKSAPASATDDYDYPPSTAATATSASTPAASAAAGAPRASQIAGLKLESFTIKAGTAVRWTNADAPNIPHGIAGDKGEFTSNGPIAGGGFAFAFEKPGVVAYHCTIHASMTATITVQ